MLALWMALPLLPPAAAAADRVASAGICADEVVVPLVERQRIAGVSAQASDPATSPVASQAQGLPVLAPSAEALVAAGASVVVLNTYGDGKTKAMLEKLGVRVIRAPYDPGLSQVPQSLRRLGEALGERDRAETLAADFERRMAAVAANRPAPPITAAYYRPDGGSAGTGTYVAEAMAMAGYDSLAAKLGQPGWGRLDLESLALNPPEATIVSFFDMKGESLRRLFGRHPVFRQQMAAHPVIAIPGRLWGCGGWPVELATEAMAAHHPLRRDTP